MENTIQTVVEDERSYEIPFNFILQILSILQDNNLINAEKERG